MPRHQSTLLPESGDTERAASLAFFLSGVSALIFEVVWFHACGLLFGNTIWSTSIVLSSFMAGLAIGSALVARVSDRIRDFLRTYAALEIVVAVTGVVLTIALFWLPPALMPIVQALSDSPSLVNLLRFTVAFLALVVPTTAMGATLPLLAGGISATRTQFGPALGRLYGWNTIGAVGGALASEMILIRWFGVFGSAVAAGALNIVAAAVVLAASRPGNRAPSPKAVAGLRQPAKSRAPGILACAFLAGAGLMALEVIWFRMLSMFVVNTTLAVSVMLAAVLSAIGVGGLVASRWTARDPNAERHAPAVAFAIACCIVFPYASFRMVLGDARPSAWYHVLWLACWLTYPASLLSGALFTLLGQALRFYETSDGRSAGRLVLANTIGAMAGPIVMGLVLLPAFGMERSLAGSAVLYGVIGLLGLRAVRSEQPRRAWAMPAAGICAVLALLFFPFGLMDATYFAGAVRAHVADGSEIIASKEGREETIFLTRKSWQGEPIYHRLVTNGFSMTATAVPGKRYMRQFVYLPWLLRGGALQKVLVICYGVGVTAGAVTDLPSVRSLDVVEISPDIVAMSDFVYPQNERPLSDPRVKLHLEDGRFFLQNTGEQFDLITGEPPPPLTAGTVNIYTQEYFQLIHDHLRDEGIATYWLPVGRNESIDHLPIIRAFCDVFEDCSLWNGTPADLMLMGSKGAGRARAVAAMPEASSGSVLESHLREAGFERREQLAATFLGDASYLKVIGGSSPPLVDNFPRRMWRGASSSALQLLFDQGGPEFHDGVLDASRARQAFEDSSYVAALWPEDFRREVLPFFDVQRIVNRVLGEGAHVLGQIEDLDFILRKTSLKTIAYWVIGLGNHPILRRVDTMPNDGRGEVEYVQGVRSLVDRDFRRASALLAEAHHRGFPGTRPLLAYALALAGEIDAARQVAAGAERGNGDQRHFWEWMQTTLNVSP